MTATSEATDPSTGRLDQFHGTITGKPLKLAISGNDPGCLEQLLISSIKETVGPIREVESSFFLLAQELFEAISKSPFDVLIIIVNPNWGETRLASNAQRDGELLRMLRQESAAPLIVIHNGSAGHTEASLKAIGVDLVLPMPFHTSVLQNFLSTRLNMSNHDLQSAAVPPSRSVQLFKPLLEASTKDVFRKNAFRVTGLPVDATTREATKHLARLTMLAELGRTDEVRGGYFSLKPAPVVDDIREAFQKLKDPEKRLFDEFFWFWPEEFGSSRSDPAMQAVATGNSSAAIEIWTAKEVGGNCENANVIARHNLAVAYHIRAVDWENYCVKNDVEPERRQKIAGYWQHALKRWRSLATDEGFWKIVSDRLRQLNEPALKPDFASHIRETVLEALVKINAELAIAFAESRKLEVARLHIQLMKDLKPTSASLERIGEIVLQPIRRRLEQQIAQAKARAKDNPKEGIKAAHDLLAGARGGLDLFNLFFATDSDLRSNVFDEVVGACNELQVTYHKETGDNNSCLTLLKGVLRFARSPELQLRIQENVATLLWLEKSESVYAALKTIQDSTEHPRVRLDKFQETVVPVIYATADLANDSDRRNALFDAAAIVLRDVSLEAWNKHDDGNTATAANQLALKFACGTDLKQRLLEDQKTLERVRPMAGLTPISAAPTLRTINGCGFTLYGATDPDPRNGSYLSTYYFVFFGIPIFPIGRYRVANTGNAYRFFGKAPLRPFDKWHLGISLGAIAVFIMYTASFDQSASPGTSRNGASNYSLPSSQTSAAVDTSKSEEQLEREAAERNARLDNVFNQFNTPSSRSKTRTSTFGGNNSNGTTYRVPNSVSNMLDQEKAGIESDRAALETFEAQIEQLGRQIESERIYLDRTSAYAVQQFNAKVNRYNALSQQDKAATAAFNNRVANYNAKLQQYGH